MAELGDTIEMRGGVTSRRDDYVRGWPIPPACLTFVKMCHAVHLGAVYSLALRHIELNSCAAERDDEQMFLPCQPLSETWEEKENNTQKDRENDR